MLAYSMVHFVPSQFVARALYLALKILDSNDGTPTLKHYLPYTNKSLLLSRSTWLRM